MNDEQHLAQHGAEQAGQPAGQPAPTLLFIDDDREFLLGKALFFRNRGFTVLTAEGSDEALELLGRCRPDLIFIDLMMEHHDSGFTLTHQIRQLAGLAEVPVVMLSGVAAATGRRFDREGEGLKRWSRLDGFLDKPVSSRQLLQVVQERLGRAVPVEHGSEPESRNP